jgi:glycosyltransferase involved in cell wall biosynthesis
LAGDPGERARARAAAARPGPDGGRQVRLWIWLVVLIISIPIVLQIFASVENARHASDIFQRIASGNLSAEKLRQEVIALRIQNERVGDFWGNLVGSLIPLAAPLALLAGGVFALVRFLDARAKDRTDREANDLNGVLDKLAVDNPQSRAFGVAGLQHFLTPDKQAHHLTALSALVATARREGDDGVIRDLRITAEQAIANLPLSTLQQVSWQGVKLPRLEAKSADLRGLDLRDAVLDDAVLPGTLLSGCRLEGAKMKGADLEGCDLREASLYYVDLAGANLRDADLRGANLLEAFVQDMDLARAKLQGANLDFRQTPWQLIRNWRSAEFGDGWREELIDRFGPEPSGPRVLMLMWEIAPLVAGGTWTACYHLVRNLRRLGADVTVVVPWEAESIDPMPFGTEVEIIALGMTPPVPAMGPYAAAGDGQWSPYATMWASPYGYSGGYPGFPSPYQYGGYPASVSPYGYGGWIPPSPYGYGYLGGAPYYSPYYSPYVSPGRPGSGPAPGGAFSDLILRPASPILKLIEEFAERLMREKRRRVREGSWDFQIVHAHDWVTFPAARRVAGEGAERIPWVAHFHSTVEDREPGRLDPIVTGIEHIGARDAAHVIVPSSLTANRVSDLYDVPRDRMLVLSNPLSIEDIPRSETGVFETRRVVFLGRLTEQKGPDLFAEVAVAVKRSAAQRREPDTRFWMFGEGELDPIVDLIGGYAVERQGPLEWGRRGEAFRDAAVVLVPSRREPFGMVIAEAMQHRVPVIYPESAGIAEVVEAGIRLPAPEVLDLRDTRRLLGSDGPARLIEELRRGNTATIDAAAKAIRRLLTDPARWAELVREQTKAIEDYRQENTGEPLRKLWQQLAGQEPAEVLPGSLLREG